MKFNLFKRNNKKGMSIMSIVMGIILVVAVAIPVTQQVIANANLTGTTATVVGLIPLILGVGALALVMGTVRQ